MNQIDFNEIKKLWLTKRVNEIIVLLHDKRERRRGSRRSKSEVIRLAELSHEVIKNMERAQRIKFIMCENTIKEIIIRLQVTHEHAIS